MNYPVRHRNGDWAMPDGPGSRPSGRTLLHGSGASRFDPYRGPSPAFVALTRNPELESPRRFEPTVKRDGDVVL